MLIQCTKKLLDELQTKPTLTIVEQPLFSWYANLITVNRRKTVVLCNDKNRYIVVLHGLKAKDLKNIGALIVAAIRETLLAECIKSEIVENFVDSSAKVAFTKTKDRSMVAKMNKACDTAQFYTKKFTNESITQIDVGLTSSAYPVRVLNKDNYNPSTAMFKDLEIFGVAPIFRCKALQIKVTLDIENHEVWRKAIVPSNITFTQLHDIIQIIFDWHDYHLHDFYIFYGEDAIVNLVCNDEALEYDNDIKMMLETGIRLSEYVPEYTRIKYTYDFGDNWEHYIEVEKVIDEYDKSYPICLEAVGNAPPEDVGGEVDTILF
jgi:hypothetical protein